MAIQGTTIFGIPQSRSSAGAKGDKPKAQFWLNIGYSVTLKDTDSGDEQTSFVSLPMGVALDTMEELKTNSNNEEFRAFQSARMDLWNDLMEVAKTLQPGEDKVFGEAGTLQIQLRRIKEEQAPIASNENVFRVKIPLAG